jgi:Domain of unknown function (DUF4129)
VGWAAFLLGSVLYAILFAVFWFVSLFGIQFSPPRPPTNPNADAEDVNRPTEPRPEPGQEATSLLNLSPEMQSLIWGVAMLLVLVVVVWLVSRGLRGGKRRRARSSNEERESIGGWATLVDQFRAWLDRLLARFRPVPPPGEATVEDDLAGLQGRPEWSGTLTVRQIYARLLGLSAKAGFPRARQQTPIEYLAVLSRAMPQLRPDFADITSAYLEARYGPLPASAPAVLAANNAWKNAEPALRAAGVRN